jgi:hypothetical protein
MDIKITPPLGYGSVSPLAKSRRVALPEAGSTPGFVRSMHLLPVSLAEVVPACRDYPLAFVPAEGTGKFAIVAVLGLQEGQNLFLMEDGCWDRRAYLPAYVRRYPFCMATVTRDGELQPERIFCVADSALSASGNALFDESGKPLPAWAGIEHFLLEFEKDLARAAEFCALLDELELLEPISVSADVGDGFTLQLNGLHRIRREQFNTLPENVLRSMLGGESADAVFAHVFSLANFKRLLARRSIFAAPAPAVPGKLN